MVHCQLCCPLILSHATADVEMQNLHLCLPPLLLPLLLAGLAGCSLSSTCVLWYTACHYSCKSYGLTEHPHLRLLLFLPLLLLLSVVLLLLALREWRASMGADSAPDRLPANAAERGAFKQVLQGMRRCQGEDGLPLEVKRITKTN
jgi:hypothetical protein